MKKIEKIHILEEYVRANQMKKEALERYATLREEIIKNIETGQYGHFTLLIDTKECPEYVVKAHTKTEVKVKES